MSRLRPVARLFALGLAPAACVGVSFALRNPVKFDALERPPGARRLRQREAPPSDRLSPRIIEQLSRGSILGFGAGVVIAFFSRTLVFLGGVVAGSLQIASRMGVDVLSLIPIDRKLLTESPVLRMWIGKPWFTSSFLLTFILAAFVRL